MRFLPSRLATPAAGWSRLTTWPSSLRRLDINRRNAVNCCNVLRRTASTTSPAPSASKRLDFQAIDAKWHQQWRREPPPPPETASDDKFYVLPMFPYPSGVLHLGHLRVYTISDVLARFHHMQGHRVLHPMSWDAFGLPAENAAIERGVDPAEWTLRNIDKMKEQLNAMGGRWDWDREFRTCDPAFYKHTQRIFLLLHERGLAYQAESLVNYDPVDRTVLANEQVDANGCSWRSGAKVEKVMLKQWFLKITAFKEALLEDLEELEKDDRWPKRVISMQRNWLGKSSGARVRFPVQVAGGQTGALTTIEAFTTRPDTLFGVRYLALSTTHPLVLSLAKRSSKLQAFLDATPALPPDTKAGFVLPGVQAINPLSTLDSVTLDSVDEVSRPLPVYVAPYVLGDYGEGAVMGVPGHDARDHAFWRENRGQEPIPLVVAPSKTDSKASHLVPGPSDEAFVHRGVLTSLCGKYAGLSSTKGGSQIVADLNAHDDSAELAESWRLRDWLISRQRYWGTPIPIVHCGNCGAVPVPVDELPVELPKLKGDFFRGKGGNPLEDAEDWMRTKCPSCGAPAKRDTDTMDTFVDSSWYFLRFADPHNAQVPFSASSATAFLPVDIYIGGVEHAILHLLYARFISKFLSTTTLWPSGASAETQNRGEPFRKLITQGMVHGKTYTDARTGRFFKPDEVDVTDPAQPRVKATGERPNVSFEKMSKSKYNGVDPGTCIGRYGADATRAHMLFSAPVSEVLEWDEERIVGIHRWFHRVWRVVALVAGRLSASGSKSSEIPAFPPLATLSPQEADLWSAVQTTVTSLNTSLSTTYALNTTVSDLISLTNALASCLAETSTPALTKGPAVSAAVQYHASSALLRMMAPMTPAFAEECWEALHRGTSRTDGTETESAENRAATSSLASTPSTTSSASSSSSSSSPSLSTSPLNSSSSSSLSTQSIFSQPFPTPDSSLAHLAAQRSRRPCAVMVNGKTRFVVELPPPPPTSTSTTSPTPTPAPSTSSTPTPEADATQHLRAWLHAEVLKTADGQKWIGADGEKNAGKTLHGIFVVRERVDGGEGRKDGAVKTVNFVFK
ncbi:MAG: hypothetical protein M1819_006833 [Sarea resinae]|nr:MAG: hypothetical protein M1819_006833 [Sarea resinae]